MKKILLIPTFLIAVFLFSINTIKAEQVSVPYKTVVKSNISTSNSGERLHNYYYDKNGNLTIHEIDSTNFEFNIYDNQNRIIEFKTYNRNYSTDNEYYLYSYGFNTYENDKLATSVQYIIQGTRILIDSLVYSYDQTGNLIAKDKWSKGTWDTQPIWSDKTTYSDFLFPDCPRLTEIWELKYGTTWKFVSKKISNTYDSKGNITQKEEKNRSFSDTTVYNLFQTTEYVYNYDGTINYYCTYRHSGETPKPYTKFEYVYNNGILEMEKGFRTQMIYPENDDDDPYELVLAPDSETTYFNSSNYSIDNTVQNFNADFTGNGIIRLTWEAPVNTTNLTGYRVIFRNKDFVDLQPNITGYSISDLKLDTYFATVQTIYGQIGSNIADPKFITISDPNCTPPKDLKLDSVVFDETTLKSSVNISWQAPQTEYQVLNYVIYLNGNTLVSNQQDTHYTYDVAYSGDFKFEIQAVYKQGISPKSEALVVPVLHKYQISLDLNNPKAGTVQGAGFFNDKSEITINATTNEGFKFKEWQKKAIPTFISVSTEPEYKFILTQNEVFVAVFDQIRYEISATAHENGTISPSGNSKVIHGKSLTYTIIPDQDYRIKKLLIDGVEIEKVLTYTFENVTENHSIEVFFEYIDGIDENENSNTTIYAFAKSININSIENTIQKIEISDITGKIVKTLINPNQTEKIKIQQTGLYIVRIYDNNNTITSKKVMIQ